MSSRADATLRAAQLGITTLVARDLTAYFGSLDLEEPEKSRDALLLFLPELIRQYGLGAASVAADWYDETRAMSGVKGRFRATPAEPVDVEVRSEATVRRVAGYLFTGGTQPLALPALIDPATKFALEPGRQTITNAAIADQRAMGWRRVTRSGSCDFCETLSTRIYSARTDGFEAHGGCLCTATPVWRT